MLVEAVVVYWLVVEWYHIMFELLEMSLLDVNVDLGWVCEVFGNLFDNVLCFILLGGSVIVLVYCDDDVVWMSVCDIGWGIAVVDLLYIFE